MVARMANHRIESARNSTLPPVILSRRLTSSSLNNGLPAPLPKNTMTAISAITASTHGV